MIERLRYPVNFVAPDCNVWPEIRSGNIQDVCEKKLEKYSVGSHNGWIVRTYFHLALRGENVSLSSKPKPYAINVVSPRDFGRRQRGINPFILVPRADGHLPELANFYLEQNEIFSPGLHSDNVPYWPQANIKPRMHDQREGLTTIGFKGRTINISANFRSEEFVGKLAEIGVSLELDSFDGLLGSQAWGDYRNLDAILAVRNLTIKDAEHKPASKLINAWFGEVPAVLGPEPAFQSIRRSELDYIEVDSPEAAISAVMRLKNDSNLFWRMVENGRSRRLEYTTEAVVNRWINLLNGRIGEAFQKWQSKSFPNKMASWTRMMLAESRSKRTYQKYIVQGPRLFDDLNRNP